jgi:hypothetical protein
MVAADLVHFDLPGWLLLEDVVEYTARCRAISGENAMRARP